MPMPYDGGTRKVAQASKQASGLIPKKIGSTPGKETALRVRYAKKPMQKITKGYGSTPGKPKKT